jgi:hypothetical protein
MTDEELQAVEARYRYGLLDPGANDVGALLTEVKRLRERETLLTREVEGLKDAREHWMMQTHYRAKERNALRDAARPLVEYSREVKLIQDWPDDAQITRIQHHISELAKALDALERA